MLLRKYVGNGWNPLTWRRKILFFQSLIKLPETLLQCFLGAGEVRADEAVAFGAEHGAHIDPDFSVI